MNLVLALWHYVAWWHPLALLGGVWCFLITFYTLYLAAINVYENRHSTSNFVLFSVAPMLVVMLACDFLAQMTLVTILFADFPRELLVTGRLKRYKALKTDSWRKRAAVAICTHGLNPFDPTKNHC